MTNINSMTINNIIDFIRDESYLDNDNQIIKNDYYFKGNIIEYNNIGNNYINILKEKFYFHTNENENELLINFNNVLVDIKFINDNNDNNDIIINLNIFKKLL